MYEAGSDFGFECVNSLSYEQCSLDVSDVSGTEESVRDARPDETDNHYLTLNINHYSCSGYLCRFTIFLKIMSHVPARREPAKVKQQHAGTHCVVAPERATRPLLAA